MIITVFGLGFVGLTTALGFADKGNKVFGVEINQERVKLLQNGKLPFHEPGLDEALLNNLNKNFFIVDDLENAVKESDCIYYCVGTPYGENGQADLTYLFKAIESTINVISDDKYRVLVTKSTIPPTTTQEKIVPFIEKYGLEIGNDIGVANNPEFLREGYCWDDFMNSDRIVLGVSDIRSEQILKQLYEKFDCPIFTVSLNTGEFIKYLSNTLLATLISFSNEMSIIADNLGDVDVANAFKILHLDKRLKNSGISSYIYPGCGYGGYCLPKDTNAIYSLSKSKGFTPKILENTIYTNDNMHKFIVDKIVKCNDINHKIGILGLSFKPESDDVRDSPSAKVIQELIERGYENIVVYDPIAVNEFKNFYDFKVEYEEELNKVIEISDKLVILTAWNEFKKLSKSTDKPIVDCRYLL